MSATFAKLAGRPRVVLGDTHSRFVARAGRQFRQLGWEVFTARSAAETKRLTFMVRPDVVVLGTNLPDESGWLVCDKLTRCEPSPEVILVSNRVTPRRRRLAAFVGASALAKRDELQAPMAVSCQAC
jgi:DNA-binding response OmpR family regulator